MYKNISSELKPITCGIVQPKKGACVSPEQVATLKPMAPDETSPVRRHSTKRRQACLDAPGFLILYPRHGPSKMNRILQTDRPLNIPQTRLRTNVP